MNTLIISGGTTDEIFLKNYLNNNKFDSIIAVDKGLEILNIFKIEPNYIIGDFDSINKEILNIEVGKSMFYINYKISDTGTVTRCICISSVKGGNQFFCFYRAAVFINQISKKFF